MSWKLEIIHKDTSYYLTVIGRPRELFRLLKTLGNGWSILSYVEEGEPVEG